MLLHRLSCLGCRASSRLSPVTFAFSTDTFPGVPTTTAAHAALPGAAEHRSLSSSAAPSGGASGCSSIRGYAATAAAARDPRFATLEQSDLDAFRRMLGPNGVLTDAASLQAVNKCAAAHDTLSSRCSTIPVNSLSRPQRVLHHARLLPPRGSSDIPTRARASAGTG